MTFRNNNAMNQFMKTYDNKLDEGTEELEEGTPEYRAMMKRYKGSDMEKVFKILDMKGSAWVNRATLSFAICSKSTGVMSRRLLTRL